MLEDIRLTPEEILKFANSASEIIISTKVADTATDKAIRKIHDDLWSIVTNRDIKFVKTQLIVKYLKDMVK